MPELQICKSALTISKLLWYNPWLLEILEKEGKKKPFKPYQTLNSKTQSRKKKKIAWLKWGRNRKKDFFLINYIEH